MFAAPNIAHGCLSLAVCMPKVRRHASVGDFLIGFRQRYGTEVIFVCRVDTKLDWPSYVKLCETTFTDKLHSSSNRRGDCYFFEDGQPRSAVPDNHTSSQAQRRDWTHPVLLSTTFVYWGDGTASDKLPRPDWCQSLVSEWAASTGFRDKVCWKKFPVTTAAFRAWLESAGPGANALAWTGHTRGNPSGDGRKGE